MKKNKDKNKSGPWTVFMDMYSGGQIKQHPYEMIYIQAPMEQAKSIFISQFGHDPSEVACNCCGVNYSISEDKSLEQVTGHYRGCKLVNNEYVEVSRNSYAEYVTLDEYLKDETVLVIYSKELK